MYFNRASVPVKIINFFLVCSLATSVTLFSKDALAVTPRLVPSVLSTTSTAGSPGSTTLPTPARQHNIGATQSNSENIYLEIAKVGLDFLKAWAWPLVVIYLIHSFKPQIAGVLENFYRAEKLKINVLGQEIELTTTEASKTLEELVGAIKSIVKEITPDERKQLEQIMQAESGRYTVKDVFPNFNRAEDNAALKTLRKFRDAQFVRPQGGGQWQREKGIEIKPFGKFIWEKVGSENLFDSRTDS
ncbi:MAG: hypothetical protein AB1589_04170 [Cyanobacteriota bacterium]